MKKIKVLFIIAAVFTLGACSDWMDMNPKNKLTPDIVLTTEGVQLFMANLYFQLPIEDFRHAPRQNNDDPYHKNGTFNNTDNMGGVRWANMTDESTNSENGSYAERDNSRWWIGGYKLLHDVNYLLSEMPNFKGTPAEVTAVEAEAHFLKAYTYFALARRYGGICLIDKLQNLSGIPLPQEEIETLKVPRSTEYDTWKAIIDECDKAIAGLGETRSRRANKYAAAALKSRAALHAASIMKFWNANLATNTGEAFERGLKYNPSPSRPADPTDNTPAVQRNSIVDADYFYNECIKASNIVIGSSYSLYKPFPSDAKEAAANIQNMFIDCNVAPEEVIFFRGFTLPGNKYAHNYDIWYNPYQTTGSWPHPGRMNPLLDLAEAYELYSVPGKLRNQFITLTNAQGYESDSEIARNNNASLRTDYKYFDNAEDLFKLDMTKPGLNDRDARFYATFIYPYETWKETTIVIKAGNVEDKPSGSTSTEDGILRIADQNSTTATNFVTFNGVQYFTFGPGSSQAFYSGFSSEGSNHTRTGFLFKKFLQPVTNYSTSWHNSTNDWPDMRYAEVLLNYMEAAYEKSTPDPAEIANALTYLNDIRRRAAHTTPITQAQMDANGKKLIERERRVEMAFENERYWYLHRRREWTEGGQFYNYYRVALLPVQDFRTTVNGNPNPNQGKWIFIRRNPRGVTGQARIGNSIYYRSIDGTGANGVVNN